MSLLVPDFAATAKLGRLGFVKKDIRNFLRLTRHPNTEPYWGKARRYRFDDPLQRFGVTYVAEELEVAFAETILHEVADFEEGRWVVPYDQIDRRWIMRYARPQAQLTLLDLTGIGLKRLGLNNDVCSLSDYGFTQQLSRAIHDQVPEADGIYYVSRQLNTSFAAALFERSDVGCGPAPIKLDAHTAYRHLLETFGVEIVSGA